MTQGPQPDRRARGLAGRLALAALLSVGWSAARGQGPAPAPPPPASFADLPPLPPEPPKAVVPAVPAPQPAANPMSVRQVFDEAVAPVSCTTCGGSGVLPGAGTCSTCGGGGMCVPGRKPCYTPSDAHFILGRFCSNLYNCLCCPDPCYQPSWVPEANAAFFQDFARPQTLQRFRYTYNRDMSFPDRAEFFWARAARDPKGATQGKGPPPPKAMRHGHFIRGEQSVDVNQLAFYNEAATGGRASFFVELFYRSDYPQLGAHHAGFADMNLGTKGMLLDCELLQLTFQFKTFLPTGAVSSGLGTGHVSLEPSLLMSLHLAPETYFQGQLAEWIPIGGDKDYAGAVLHYHGSLNRVLYRLAPNSPLIGTFEVNGWSFQDGLYTDPLLGPRRATGATYFNLGPGLRMSICNAIDFGAAIAFPTRLPNWGDPIIRTELRIIY